MTLKKSKLKTNRDATTRQGGMRRWVLPFLAALGLIVVALGVAYFLVARNKKEDNSGATSPSALSGKAVVTAQGWSRGNPSAKTVLVEFGDFQCSSCAKHRERMDRLLKKYPTDLFVYFKEFPLDTVHKNAMAAAQAAEAAGKQYKFWEMYDQLFLHQIDWYNVPDPQTFFMKYAAAIQLDINRFQQDLWSAEIQEKIFRDKFEGQQVGVISVPTFYLNGVQLPTAQNDDHFDAMITEAIKKAK